MANPIVFALQSRHLKRFFMTSQSLLQCSLMLAVIYIMSCSTPVTNRLTDADKAYLHSLFDREPKLLMDKQWDSLAGYFSQDAVRLPPNGPPIIGRDSIRQLFNSLPTVKAFHFHIDDLQGNEGIAYVRGTYDLHLSLNSNTDIKDTGKTLVIFRKEANGAWLCVADAWSSNSPPTK